MTRKTLLRCGIMSSVLYGLLNVFVPLLWPSYDTASQTVSELSAVDAPTRHIWIFLSIPYSMLTIAFAWGVWISSGENRNIRITGGLLLAYGILGLLWPFAPMHLRPTLASGGSTFSDTLHISLAIVTETLFLGALGFAAAAFGKHFRLYSVVTFVVLMIFGALTFQEAPAVSKNSPTPWIGVWERINIGVFLIWVIVLASVLLRMDRSAAKYYQKNSTTATE
jgi:hypothetical protein